MNLHLTEYVEARLQDDISRHRLGPQPKGDVPRQLVAVEPAGERSGRQDEAQPVEGHVLQGRVGRAGACARFPVTVEVS